MARWLGGWVAGWLGGRVAGRLAGRVAGRLEPPPPPPNPPHPLPPTDRNTPNIFLWLPYANIFRTGPPVFANLPLGVALITNRSV